MAKPAIDVKPMRGKSENVVITGCVRLAYQSLLEPKAGMGNDGKPGELQYVAVLLFDQNDASLALLKKVGEEAVLKKFGRKENIPPKFKSPFRDGNENAQKYPFYAGKIFVTATTKAARRRPDVVDQGMAPITNPDRIYSGAWVRASLGAFIYNRNGNQGLSFGLNNVQLLGDDERFAGARPAADEFSPVVDADAVVGEQGEKVASIF